MPEEILLFIIRLLMLACIAGVCWLVLTQVIVPLIYKQPIFPLINRGGSVLTDIREWQRKQLEDELADKKNEVEIARLEAEINRKREEVDKIRGVGDKK